MRADTAFIYTWTCRIMSTAIHTRDANALTHTDKFPLSCGKGKRLVVIVMITVVQKHKLQFDYNNRLFDTVVETFCVE